MRQFSDGGRGVALAAGAGVAWLAFYAGWLALRPGGDDALKIFADTAYLVPLAAAALLCLYAATRVPPRLRAFWWLMSGASLAWLAADTLWCVRDLVVGSVPYPWWSDAGYLASDALMFAAVYAAFRPRVRAVKRAQLVEGALVVGALSLVWWWLLVRPLEFAIDLESIVTVAYPIFCLGVLGLLAATRVLPARHGTLAMHLVAAGVAASVLTNGLYIHTSMTGEYISGAWIELGWQLQGILFSLAAIAAVNGVGRPSNWMRFRDGRELGAGVVVTGALAVALGIVALEGTDGELATATIAGAGAVAALVLVRLWLATTERSRSPALIDPETGTYNAQYFEDQLDRLIGRGRHLGDAFALGLVEIDAADASDAASDAHVARRLVAGAREVDVLSRLDPGRFALLLPNVDADEAFAVAERIRREVATHPLWTHGDTAARTVSVGVAVWTRDDDGASLGRKARGALAAAQRLGGNQVRTGSDDRVLFGDGDLDGERLEAIVRLARLVDGREGDDVEHSGTVAAVASAVALEMGLDADAVSRTYVAGLLHDLGKLALPEAMLEKPGPLDQSEWDAMVRHPADGAALAAKIGAVRDAAPIIAAHHERWDGTGYPLRLAGAHIPAEARIVAVADTLVAMTSERPYRRAQSETSALTTIWREAGTRYDPAVVSALLTLARDGRLGLPQRGRGENAGSRASVLGLAEL